jgi:hypothetical protein
VGFGSATLTVKEWLERGVSGVHGGEAVACTADERPERGVSGVWNSYLYG